LPEDDQWDILLNGLLAMGVWYLSLYEKPIEKGVPLVVSNLTDLLKAQPEFQ
jgi:hypothetical protein